MRSTTPNGLALTDRTRIAAMAAFDTTRPAYGAAPVAGQVTGFISNLVSLVLAWNDARVTRKALNALTDRELDDIGLIRGDIENVADGH
jgi:uncharacterized protein YjiS (DUF1127 family)